MAGAPGFEPGIARPKPAALPLGYAPTRETREHTGGARAKQRAKAEKMRRLRRARARATVLILAVGLGAAAGTTLSVSPTLREASIGWLRGMFAQDGARAVAVAPPPPQTPVIAARPTAPRPAAGAAPPNPAVELARLRVREIETLLELLAFRPGVIDGRTDPALAAAIQSYERFVGLAPRGEPTPQLLRHLRRLTAPMGLASGAQ